MALEGLSKEARRLGFQVPASVRLQDPRSSTQEAEARREVDREPAFRVRLYARDEAQREERTDIVKAIRERVALGSYPIAKAVAMVEMLQTQWYDEAQVRDEAAEPVRLQGEIAEARALNARLKVATATDSEALDARAKQVRRVAASRKVTRERTRTRDEREAQREVVYAKYKGTVMQRALVASKKVTR